MSENAKFAENMKVVRLEPDSQRSMRAGLARLPAVVHVLHEKSKQILQNKLKSFFDKADDSLFELADKARSNQEQNLFFDSMREVRVQRRNIEKRFANAIDVAFVGLASEEPIERTQKQYSDTLTSDALSLVQNDDLEEMVAVESSISRANGEFGEVIQLISLRLDSIAPVKVYQKNNPVGPDVICNAFLSEAKKLDIDIKAKLVLFKLFDRVVVSQLGELYKDANQILVEHNILPTVSIGGARRNDGSVSAGSASAAVSRDQSPSAGNGEGVSQEVLAVLQDVLGAAARQTTKPSDTQRLLSMLSMVQKRSGASMPTTGEQNEGQQVDVSGLIGSLRQSGNVNIGRMDDEVINLVNMLFEFILEDRNLADPMKALISRMQIPMIKVALADRTFFAKGGHAARRLLNEMATAALGWQGDVLNTARDPLFRKIESVVRRLVNEFDTDVTIFSELLADFTSFVNKEKRRIAVLERRTLDAEDGKAKAEVARTTVALEIELRTINESMPEVVNRLISEAWQNVLFVVGLKYGYQSQEWEGALNTLEDLIWSVKLPRSDEDRQRLIRLVPDLLGRLRNGLDTISFNPFVMSELFKSLEEVHLGCIRSKFRQEAPPEPEPSRPAVEKQAAVPISAGESAVKPQQAKSSEAVADTKKPGNFINPVDMGAGKTEVDSAGLSAESPPAKPAARKSTEDFLEDTDPFMVQVTGFAQGAWFEMIDATGASVRCRLAAVIKPTGKYIFVNRNGMKVAEKSQLDLALALRASTLRVLDNSMLFDRALETVVSSLRKPH